MVRYLLQFADSGDPNGGLAGAYWFRFTQSITSAPLALPSKCGVICSFCICLRVLVVLMHTVRPSLTIPRYLVEGLPQWPRFIPAEVDGALQLGGLGPEGVAAYVPLRSEDRALYYFMDEHYFGLSGRMGKILGPIPPLRDRQAAI